VLNTVRAIKEGDEFVFQQVFNQYHGKLYFFVFNKIKSDYLAEEIVQDTFIKLWKYRETLHESFSISTQLYRIASTTLIDAIRKKNTAASVIKEVQHLETQPGQNKTQEMMDAKEMLLKIRGLVQKMPPVQRRVFELSREEGLSYKEIAEKLSISVKTVEIHISKSLKFLKSRLLIIVIMVIAIIFSNTQ
jgi:RNA polymerase sigma-70 factor (family 1)